MTSMSHQHHQAMTSWHPANPTATAAIATPSYHTQLSHQHNPHHPHHHMNHHHHHEHEQSYSQVNSIDMASDTNNQYNLGGRRGPAEQQQPSATASGSPGVATATLNSDLKAPLAAQSTSSRISSYIGPQSAASGVRAGGCRQQSSPTTLGPVKHTSGLISPNSLHQQQQHHLQQQQQQDTYQEPQPLIAAHEQHHHHPQQIYQQQLQQHGHLAQSNNNNNYYDPSYQDPHNYNIGHRGANMDPFNQTSPATIGVGGPHQANSTAQCWPSSLSQSTSPQIATSPAIHQFHLGTPHQAPPNIPAPASPYHTNATYTNGYPQHPVPPPHQHHQHQHHHQQQQHYIPPHHAQHSRHAHHQAAIMHSSSSHMSSDEVFSHQHQQHHAHIAATTPITYNQFAHRGSLGMANASKQQQTTSNPMLHNTQMMQHQQSATMRPHYSSLVAGVGNIDININDSSSIKVPTTTSETLAPNIRSNAINVISSPKSSHQHQNILSSSPGQNVGRRQSSSVASMTSSAGSNLSDHHSPTVSPSSVHPNQNVPPTLSSDQAANNAAKVVGTTRLASGDDRLAANVTDTEQDSKESQLSQLHQQCAVLLDEQQQQQHNIAINSPNTNNNNGNSASNSAINNNNTPSNGNNSGRSKRLRTSFKHNQLKEMKRWFARNQNPDAKDLKTLAQTTGLSKRVLQVWFQNARAKYRRNNAKAASQQLYDVNQHTSHMLQFQQQQQQHQQQNYHHHHHLHHHPRPMTDSQPMNSQQQQIGQHHHLPSQGSPTTIARTFAPLGAGSEGSQQIGLGAVAINSIDLHQQPSSTDTTKKEEYD